MNYSELLQTLAEVAVAFAGFASLISILGRSSEFIDATRLLGMVRTSLLATGFALFPFVPHALGASEPATWRISGAALFLASGVQTFRAWRLLYRAWRKGLWQMSVGYYTFPAGFVHLLLAAAAALSGDPSLASGLYIASLVCLVSVAGALFLGVFTSFIERRDLDRPTVSRNSALEEIADE